MKHCETKVHLSHQRLSNGTKSAVIGDIVVWETLGLTQTFYKRHQKIQNDKQIYMELKNMNKRRLRGWRFTMNEFKSWSMVYNY